MLNHAGSSRQALAPPLLEHWDSQANSGVEPGSIAARSHRPVWWRCDQGHRWCAPVSARSNGTGCPYCLGRLPTATTSLAALHPALAAQWHPTRNEGLTPADVRPGSQRKVWWICARGHEWQTTPCLRSSTGGTGCPDCASRRQRGLPLKIVAPELLAEWAADLNDGPGEDVPAGSARSVWWRCGQGHEWRTRLVQRSRRRTRCPFCAGRRATPERNLALTHPRLAEQWHPTLNGDVGPESLLPQSSRYVWWRCPLGHTWQARVASRAGGGTGCPSCRRPRPT